MKQEPVIGNKRLVTFSINTFATSNMNPKLMKSIMRQDKIQDVWLNTNVVTAGYTLVVKVPPHFVFTY